MTYDENVQIWKGAYTELATVCDKYPSFKDKYDGFDDIHKMSVSAKNHLMLIDWYEKYGLKLEHRLTPYSSGWCRINDNMAFMRFGDAAKDKAEGSGRFISWPDDERQPMNEWLMELSFSTGAYIFGRDYSGQKALFQDFFNELKTYKPDYLDSVNHNLYWKLENANAIYEDFSKILTKYRERNTAELKQREAERLRKELAKLEGETPNDPQA